MSLTVSLIAKLCRVEPALARRAWNFACSLDDPATPPLPEFRSGEGARCFAFAKVVRYRPMHFYGGIAGLTLFPLYMMVKYGPSWFFALGRTAAQLAAHVGIGHGG